MADKLISLNAALDTFGLSEKTRKYGGDHSGYDTLMLYEVQDALEALPDAGPAWIPCTECLPVAYIDVIVSSKRGVQVMRMTPGGYWTDGAQLDAPGYVEAWMPLPERWKGAE